MLQRCGGHHTPIEIPPAISFAKPNTNTRPTLIWLPDTAATSSVNRLRQKKCTNLLQTLRQYRLVRQKEYSLYTG